MNKKAYEILEKHLMQLYGVLDLNDFLRYGNILNYVDTTKKMVKLQPILLLNMKAAFTKLLSKQDIF